MSPRPLHALAGLMLLVGLPARAQTPAAPPDTLKGLPLLFHEDFSAGSDRWETTDVEAWAVVQDDGGPALALTRQSAYEPPVRSPANMALVADLWVSDFILEARVKSTTREYGHRDLCFFYGWQDPAHFYYTHLATAPDPHAHSIFIVDGAPRVSIADERSGGVRWGDGYHTVRIERSVEHGTITVYFDDLTEPVLVAQDTRFTYGRLGVGSFDDTGIFDDVRVWGRHRHTP